MPLYYDEFSDLAIDWPMIFVGWHGFGGGKLSAKQVVALALEQIGRGSLEQDETAALLANTDPQDWQTIDRYLAQITETQFDRETALRKWRLSELKQLLPEDFQALTKKCDYFEDEWLNVLEELADFWNRYDELPDSFVVRRDLSAGTIEEMLAEQQTWAAHEEAVLRGTMGAIE